MQDWYPQIKRKKKVGFTILPKLHHTKKHVKKGHILTTILPTFG